MAQLRTIPIAQIAVSPDNTRLFDRKDKEAKVSLDELAASMRELGLQQPPKVRPNPAGAPPWLLVFGERRLRAARDILKWTEIEVLVDEDLTARDAGAATVVENLQRRDLHPMDQARGIALLRQQGTSIKDVAKRLGRREEWIKERLTLCALPAEVQETYRRSARMTLDQALALRDYTHGGKDNKGFTALSRAVAASIADGSNPTGSLALFTGTRPDLVIPITHAYHEGGGRWGGHFFDTRTICTACPWAAFRPGHYDGTGYCLLPTHYADLQRKGQEKYDAAQAARAAHADATGGATAPTANWRSGMVETAPTETAAEKGKKTRQRHKDQKTAYYPTVSAIERAIDMIPAVDTVDVAVLCAYTLTTDHVDHKAVEQVMTRHALKSFPSPASTPGRGQIERLRSFDGVALVRYTLEALLLTQAMRARDYDPGRTPADPVLALYLPGQAAAAPTLGEDVSPDTRHEVDASLADEEVRGDESAA